MLAVHHLLRTWRKTVDTYVALTEFGRSTFVAGGFPKEKIVVKPNFVYPDPGLGTGRGGYAIFVGRLSEEKGIQALLDAWRLVSKNVPLKIVGGGPLEPLVQQACAQDPRISFLGHKPINEVADMLGAAAFLIFPSLWYEGMPRTIIEAYSKGTPVIASNLGAMRDLILHERTGWHFEAGDSCMLAKLIDNVWDNNVLDSMRNACRHEFELKYSFEGNYQQLMAIYHQSIARAKKV